jgi:hypothetical protein
LALDAPQDVKRSLGPTSVGAAALVAQGGSATTQREVMPTPTGSFEEASRTLADAAASTNLDQSSLPSPSKNVLRDLDHSLTDLVAAVVRTNLRASQDVLGVSTPGELAALQQRFICDYMDALLLGSVQLISAIQNITNSVGPSLPQRVESVEKRRSASEAAAD